MIRDAIAAVLLVVALLLIVATVDTWLFAEQQLSDDVVTCYLDGAPHVSVPRSAEDFLMSINTPFTRVTWSDAQGAKRVLVTSLPCVYLTSGPADGSTSAD